jgi:peptide/nickel transport system substrate-binding protein
VGLSKRAILALAGLIFTCTACGTTHSASTGSTSTTVPTQIVLAKDGVVTVGVPSLPVNFNPSTVAGSNQVTAMVMASVWPQTFVLNNYNSQQCLESVSGICEGLLTGNNPAQLVSNNPQTIVYSIDPHAHWSDGVPITATDFIYNWKMQLAVGATLPASDPLRGYQDIASITAQNTGKTVTVVFTQPFADWQSLFTNLVPAHIAKDLAGWNTYFATSDARRMLSGGPFLIQSIDPGHDLVLVRNSSYWGPRPGLREIVFRVESSTAATLQALAKGTIDMASLLPSPQVTNTVLASSDLVESTQPGPDLWQLDFNLADASVANVAVRQAIALAVDRHQIVSDTVGLLTPFNNVASNHLFPYGYQGSQSNDSTYEQVNLTQALTDLTSAGYTVGADGVARDGGGNPLVLNLLGPAGNNVIAGVEAQIQAELLQIGITVTIHNVSSSTLLGTDLPNGNFQMAVAPYLMSQFLSTTASLYTNPTNPLFTGAAPGSATESAAVESGVVTRDVTGLNDPGISSLYLDASQELNAGSTTTYNQIDTSIWADLPSIPIFQMPVAFVTRVRVLNVANSQGWLGPMWNAQNWTIQLSPPPTTTTTLAN